MVAIALAVSPALKAAQARLDAANARIAPAGARPDPMLIAGIQNLPITSGRRGAPDAHGTPAPGPGPEPMTMRVIGVSQTLPYPGKLTLQTRAARGERAAVEAELESVRLDVALEVKREYYALAFIDRALEIVSRTHAVLGDLITAAEAQYSVGRGAQADVLRSRVEAALLGEQASDLLEQRRAAAARLNALLDRPSDAALGAARIGERIARAAIPDSATGVRFASAALGARAVDSPILPLDSLQALAILASPMLRAHQRRIDAQRTRVALARKAHLPNVDLALSYGQRPGLPDMVTATVSIPLALQKGRKQSAEIAGAEADLAAIEAEHHGAVNELRARVARRVADLERARTQLAIALRALLPQTRATLSSAASSYQVGRVDFASLVDAQAAVFDAETSYHRSLTDFATGLAELERSVGTGVLR